MEEYYQFFSKVSITKLDLIFSVRLDL
jgi:hypothetical protein